MEKQIQVEYLVHSYEVDYRGEAKFLSILNYLQDAAGIHAHRLGVSIEQLLPRQMTWVLSRYHLKIFRYPRWKERVRVITWPSDMQEIFALRDFEVTDGRGEQLLVATTSWLVLSLQNRRPAKLKEVLPHFECLERRALTDDFRPLPSPESADLEFTVLVRQSDLDLNGHVNHSFYIQWALESVPREIWENKRPAEIEAAFRGEAFGGDRIIVRTQRVKDSTHPQFLHQLIKADKGTELTVLRTSWR
ncbi:MAG: thioesterase [Calditrichia bacterium]